MLPLPPKALLRVPPRAAPRVALPWIIRLRYAMAMGQIATVLIVNLALHINLPLAWILIAPVFVIASNAWLHVWLQRRAADNVAAIGLAESTLVAWVFVLDTLCLTAVLMLAGGPNNPFSLLYLVHLTLSATILTQRQTWALGALACFCFASLFWWYRPIAALEMHHDRDIVNLHLTGMWLGFAVASFLVTLFAGKISELLREREESLLRMQEELGKKDRLASLVTLAAGAAHELSTPLGTIAIVAKELERYSAQIVRDGAIASAITDDSRLIRTEVDRCSEILRRMSVIGAEPAGEALEAVTVALLLAGVRNSFSSLAGLAIKVSAEDGAEILLIPRHAVEQAIVALVKNAVEASPALSPVHLSVSRNIPGSICFVVKDSGCGMSTDALRHAGEPFFTTKQPGKGMGLGIFLVQTLADRLGGRLTLESSLNASTANSGTTAVLELPSACRPAAAGDARPAAYDGQV